MKHFIITYENNLDFARETSDILKRDWDIDCEIIVGHTIGGKYHRTNVLTYNWIDFILPRAMQCDEDVIIFEDDIRLVKSIEIPECDVYWFGYRKGRLTNKRPYITGTQGLFFKKHILLELYDNFNGRKRKCHTDYALSQFCCGVMEKYHIEQPKLSLCYEQDHTSLISMDDWSKFSKPPKVKKDNLTKS
jgi:hypothetical protein|tara:strand:- start:293 stop:862 length:570 start_codon:yes stop_codon:yes gene_type:complete